MDVQPVGRPSASVRNETLYWVTNKLLGVMELSKNINFNNFKKLS